MAGRGVCKCGRTGAAPAPSRLSPCLGASHASRLGLRRYYLQGVCRNGINCPWLHSDDPDEDLQGGQLPLDMGQLALDPGGPIPQVIPMAQARAYSLDCEFIKVRQGKGPEARTFNVTVSVGIVSEQLETILYARVKAPERCQVWDDSFARTVGNLEADVCAATGEGPRRRRARRRSTAALTCCPTRPQWSIGIRVEIARALVREFIESGDRLVGWQVEEDLRGLRLEDVVSGARPDQVLDLSDMFKTALGNKCQLSEAYREIFGRQGQAHDACGDARMCAEIYNWWLAHEMRPQMLNLRWFYVRHWAISTTDFERFKWTVLRPERSDRATCIEEVDDEEAREFVLKFRTEGERMAYFNLVKRRVCHLYQCEAPPMLELDESLVRCEFSGAVTCDLYDKLR